jgi:hypothetical protein
VKHYADSFSEFREVGRRMLECWDRGIAGLHPEPRGSVRSSGLRDSIGLSNPKRRRQRKRNPFWGKDGVR